MSRTSRTRSLGVVVLAAGKGKRMRSVRPKVLHEVAGKPSLWHVTMAAMAARPSKLVFVVGYRGEDVEAAVRSWDLAVEPVFVDQGEPLGTGHAVGAAEESVGRLEEVLVLSGDDPLVRGEDVRRLLGVHRRTKAAATILTTFVDDPKGYGRVVRDGTRLVEIVEEAEAGPEIRRINEISTLVYAFRREDLYRALPLVGRENRQREYYLPDVLSILRDKGEKISAVPVDLGGGLGLNSRGGLAKVERIVRARIVDEHMRAGVTFVDPDAAYVDVGVRIGADTVIQPLTFLQGATRIGRGASIGPGTRLVDTVVGDGADVTFSVARQSKIGPRALVGPYASLRPGTVIEEGGKAGTFVEMKNTRLGKGSKVPHLAYMGDATIGRGVNVGAGAITCNYDGYEKHPTVIGDEAFIGSDTMLVAPLRIGKRAWTGAGSTVTEDVAEGALAVERAKQRVIRGYDDRQRAAHGGRAPGSKRPTDPLEDNKQPSKPKKKEGRSRA